MKIKMAWANIDALSKAFVNDVLDSGWISRRKYIPQFEEEVARIHGAKYGILVNSGTDALRISLATLKEIYKWPNGSEVIVPALTFVATVNAIIQNGLTPRFADVESSTGNICLDSVTRTLSRSIKAFVPVHLFGLPVNIQMFGAKGKYSYLKTVEDSCETFGVHKIQGDMACFSFYMSHHISTGVGGMILTNNPKYERIARSYSNHGRIDDGSHFKFGRVGYSSRSTEMEAALGLAALERWEGELGKRRSLAAAYTQRLDVPLYMPHWNAHHSWMFYPIRLKTGRRDALLQYLRKQGIESREAMPLINQPVFKDLYKKGSCPNAENWTKNGLLLPLHPQMTQKDVDYVCGKIRRFFN
jgi:perosamine synthetase